MLAAYVFCHYEWQFEFLHPTIAEIVKEYVKVHSDKYPLEEDAADGEADGEGRQTTKPTMSMESQL